MYIRKDGNINIQSNGIEFFYASGYFFEVNLLSESNHVAIGEVLSVSVAAKKRIVTDDGNSVTIQNSTAINALQVIIVNHIDDDKKIIDVVVPSEDNSIVIEFVAEMEGEYSIEFNSEEVNIESSSIEFTIETIEE